MLFGRWWLYFRFDNLIDCLCFNLAACLLIVLGLILWLVVDFDIAADWLFVGLLALCLFTLLVGARCVCFMFA